MAKYGNQNSKTVFFKIGISLLTFLNKTCQVETGTDVRVYACRLGHSPHYDHADKTSVMMVGRLHLRGVGRGQVDLVCRGCSWGGAHGIVNQVVRPDRSALSELRVSTVRVCVCGGGGGLGVLSTKVKYWNPPGVAYTSMVMYNLGYIDQIWKFPC